MKRLSLIVSLAVCLSLVFGSNALAGWGLNCPDKTVSQGATFQYGIEGEWDIALVQITLPLIIREVDAGSFWAGTLPHDTLPATETGVAWQWNNAGWATIIEEVRPAVPSAPCATDGDVGYDAVTPDHISISGQGMAPNFEPARTMSVFVELTMTATTVPGDFEVDTACFTGSLNRIYMVDEFYSDHGPAATFHMGTITIEPNECPNTIGAMTNAVVNGTEGDVLTNTHNGTYADKEGDAKRFYKVSGPGTVNELTGAWNWPTVCCDAGGYTVTIEVADAAHTGGGGCPNNIISFTGTVALDAIDIDCGAEITVHFGGTATRQVGSTTICNVDFAGAHTSTSGAFSWLTTCQDLGDHSFTITATDECNPARTEQCDVIVHVTNGVVQCENLDDMFLFTEGYEVDLDDIYDDPDGDDLEFWEGCIPTGAPFIDPTPPDNMPTLVNGVFTWYPSANDAQFNGGLYHICVTIWDGCEMKNCCWWLQVQYTQPYKISVLDPEEDPELMDHYVHTLNGRKVIVGVHMKNGFIQGTGAFDLLLCYDCSALAFVKAAKGDGIDGWEYFTYRYGPFGNNCGTGCPSCYIRMIGIRDMNNGIAAPAGSEFVNGFIAYLTFWVSEDRSLIGMCPRIGFCSIDCGDNVISDVTGYELALGMADQNDPEGYLLTLGPDYDLEECLEGFREKNEPTPFIYFDPGYICIVPPDDDRGDLNLNGIANEVGDAVLYTNYFIYGPSVWDPIWYENQILASDINDDGIVTTVADLVYLIRIITGDAQPFPNSGEGSYKLNPYATALDVRSEMVDGQMVITTNSTSDLGAGHLVFRYTGLTVGEVATSTGLDVMSHAANGELKVLVYSKDANSIEAGVAELVTIATEGNGSLELVESSFSTADGALMTVNLSRVEVPKAYELMQNYPNPFNASTMIRFALPVASNWSLNIYNVAGQVVETFEGSSEAGLVNISWNADVASGIYFYKLTADNFTSTKKMVLMK